jgi:arsenite oxidase small subunit
MNEEHRDDRDLRSHDCAMTCELDRRSFLFGTGAAVVAVLIPGFGAAVYAAQRAVYPRRVIGKLSALKDTQPLTFRYPWDHPQCECVLLRLTESAGGGVGPNKNIVAFHTLCTHVGASIPATAFHGTLGIAGPCPLHLTTFDLTKHGMVVSGHATQGLPQVLLELEGDDIVATGVLGLLYGLADNRVPLGKGT